MKFNEAILDKIIKAALEEDLGKKGDITSKAIFPAKKKAKAQVISKGSGVVAGLKVSRQVFKTLDPKVTFAFKIKEGEKAKKDQSLADIKGSLQAILAAERVALNFLQHLSGIATLTAKFVAKARPYNAKIFDTRKTTPGFRVLEKYAVRVGGGFNHRLGLYDGILIKDNHIQAAGGLALAIEKARNNLPAGTKIEVEAENLKEVREALAAKADVIMVDNMRLQNLKKAVKLVDKHAIVEASGGITLENVAEIAKTGADWISVGALTQAAPPLDISLEIRENDGTF